MYCALGAKDGLLMKEVLHIGSGQLEELSERLGGIVFPNEPVEVSLYRSLVQMTQTRLFLLEKY